MMLNSIWIIPSMLQKHNDDNMVHWMLKEKDLHPTIMLWTTKATNVSCLEYMTRLERWIRLDEVSILFQQQVCYFNKSIS